MLVLALASVAWAFGYASMPEKAPSYALESRVVLRAEMALALTAAAAIPLMLVGRLLAGRFPDRISAQGAEWLESAPDMVEAIDDLQDNIDALDNVIGSIAAVLDDHERRIETLEP